jgi:hypothetical protein
VGAVLVGAVLVGAAPVGPALGVAAAQARRVLRVPGRVGAVPRAPAPAGVELDGTALSVPGLAGGHRVPGRAVLGLVPGLAAAAARSC